MDILAWFGALLLVTLLGLLVAFSPMLIVMDIVIVLKSRRPILNSILLIAGVVSAVYVIFFVASQIASANSAISLTGIRDSLKVPPLLDIIAGALLAIFGLRMYFSKQREVLVVKRTEITIPEKPIAVFAVAFFKSCVSVTNIFAALIIARLSITHNWGIIPGSVVMFWALLVGVGPFLYIGYLKIFEKKSLNTIDQKVNNLLERDTRLLLPTCMAIIGVLFFVYGLVHL